MWLGGRGFDETFGHHASKSADSVWLASSPDGKVAAPWKKKKQPKIFRVRCFRGSFHPHVDGERGLGELIGFWEI